MSEIHKNTSQFVYLDVCGGAADAPPTAVLTDASGLTRSLTVTQDAAPTGVDDRYHVVLTMADTQNEGDISISWDFTIGGVAVNKVDDFSVVTPYLTIAEVKKIWDTATDEEAQNIEASVRHIINAHTGQSFGKSTGVKLAQGTGSTLTLPERIISVYKVNGSLAADYFDIVGDGWYLKFYAWGVPPVKADYYGLHQHVGGVIHNPDSVKFGQFSDTTCKVEGTWGWNSVPEPVKEAARLLVNDYACGDSNYRDRYLTSMTAADWRIQFHSGAFRQTGNVRADQLLDNYVLKRGWAVL